jgi:ribonuclease P protein component
MREAHVPAQHPQAEEEARLPRAHANARRPGGPEVSPPSRPQAPLGLIRPVRDRAAFAALARARRFRRGPVTVRFIAGEGPPRVAYAIGRSTGGAVVRNRARRRMRAAVRASAARLPPGTYLFGAGREVVTMPYEALERCVLELVAAVEEAG